MVSVLIALLLSLGLSGCGTLEEVPQAPAQEIIEVIPSETPTDTIGITVENWEKVVVGETTYDEVVALFGQEGDWYGVTTDGKKDGYTWDNYPVCYVALDFDLKTHICTRKWIDEVGDKEPRMEGEW